MKQFIQILKTRIRISTIKRYKENGETSITIVYNSSVNRPELEVFRFETIEERNKILETLDNILL